MEHQKRQALDERERLRRECEDLRQRRADEHTALDRATLDSQAIAQRLEQERQAEELAKQQKERQAAAMRSLQ